MSAMHRRSMSRGYASIEPSPAARVQPALAVVEPSEDRSAGVRGEPMLIALLTLFNDSHDTDAVTQQSLQLVSAAVGARAGEIWLVPDGGGSAEMRFASADRGAGTEPGPHGSRPWAPSRLVDRVVNTGRPATARVARDVFPLRATTHTAMAFPIGSGDQTVGALVLAYPSAHPPGKEDVAAAVAACHHLGGFLERVRAEGTLQATARELSELASTDSTHRAEEPPRVRPRPADHPAPALRRSVDRCRPSQADQRP